MSGLEYPLFFGVPNNTRELNGASSRCVCPFLARDEAEAHFARWLETLCRWKGVANASDVRKGADGWSAEAAGFTLRLAPRPIELWVPLDSVAYETLYFSFWQRDLW